jgi:hypothetical protein
MVDMRSQAVVGVVPPDVAEALLAERWPSVASRGGIARLGSAIQEQAAGLFRATIKLPTILAIILVLPVTIIAFFMASLAWLFLSLAFLLKIGPFVATRYTLTNRRLMIRKGLKPRPVQEVKLSEIEEVRVVPDTEQPFYLAADLEIISDGKSVLRLAGVPEYKTFKRSIEDAYVAWARPQPKEQIHPATELTGKK